MTRAALAMLLLVAAGGDFPAQVRAGDRLLVLNGVGVRTYSLLGIEVYRAALYVELPSADAAAILGSPGIKEIRVRYLRDGDRSLAIRGWERSFDDACGCAMPAAFRARIADIRAGDEERYVFLPDRAEIAMNGGPPTMIPGISRLLLSTFIGDRPPTAALKRALLGAR